MAGPYTRLFQEVYSLFKQYATARDCDFEELAVESAILCQKYETTPQRALCVDLLIAVTDELERLKGGK